MFRNLVRDGFLEPHNQGRGSVYSLPGAALPTPEEVFGDGSRHLTDRSAHLPESSAHLPPGSAYMSEQSHGMAETRDADGRLLSAQWDAPVVGSWECLSPEHRTAE